jgi:hypothetical protein
MRRGEISRVQVLHEAGCTHYGRLRHEFDRLHMPLTSPFAISIRNPRAPRLFAATLAVTIRV